MHALLRALAVHLPSGRLTNEQLQAEHPDWNIAQLAAKIGIDQRSVAGEDETAGDLACAAGNKLLGQCGIDRGSIDFLLYCTQSPDVIIPANACVLHHRLGLRDNCAAIDINQACSGYVYGLHLARSLVISGSSRNVLLITAETYSKYIDPGDRTTRLLFGDAASASLISAEGPGAIIGNGCLGTDGSGASNLTLVRGWDGNSAGGVCCPNPGTSHRQNGILTMNGYALLQFALRRVPEVVQQTLAANGLAMADVNWFVLHQANRFMNEHLRVKLGLDATRAPEFVRSVGNTVSNTIPIVLAEWKDRFRPGDKTMVIGFGTGYSWGACVLDWGPVLVA
jgi:3-oxoacyl-[acyl-carrier-protein] synthase-3